MTDPAADPSPARPRVTLHYAQSLDGRIATHAGSCQWISGEPSRTLQHQLRAAHAAVLVGVGTVVADDPRLTVRLVPGRSPLRVVLDSTCRLPLTSRVLTDDGAATLVATTARAPAERRAAVGATGADVVVLPADGRGRVDVSAVLRELAHRSMPAVLVEGGGEVITSMLHAGVVDRLVVCVSPVILGAGVDSVGDLGVRDLADAGTLHGIRSRWLGDALVLEASVSFDGGHR